MKIEVVDVQVSTPSVEGGATDRSLKFENSIVVTTSLANWSSTVARASYWLRQISTSAGEHMWNAGEEKQSLCSFLECGFTLLLRQHLADKLVPSRHGSALFRHIIPAIVALGTDVLQSVVL